LVLCDNPEHNLIEKSSGYINHDGSIVSEAIIDSNLTVCNDSIFPELAVRSKTYQSKVIQYNEKIRVSIQEFLWNDQPFKEFIIRNNTLYYKLIDGPYNLLTHFFQDRYFQAIYDSLSLIKCSAFMNADRTIILSLVNKQIIKSHSNSRVIYLYINDYHKYDKMMKILNPLFDHCIQYQDGIFDIH
jgi:hypothetical protein